MSARDDYSVLLLLVSIAPPNPGFSLSRPAFLSPEGLAEQQQRTEPSLTPSFSGLVWFCCCWYLVGSGSFSYPQVFTDDKQVQRGLSLSKATQRGCIEPELD